MQLGKKGQVRGCGSPMNNIHAFQQVNFSAITLTAASPSTKSEQNFAFKQFSSANIERQFIHRFSNYFFGFLSSFLRVTILKKAVMVMLSL